MEQGHKPKMLEDIVNHIKSFGLEYLDVDQYFQDQVEVLK